MNNIYTSAQKNIQVKVWDVMVRLFHWSLVIMFASAYIFSEHRSVHRYLGYCVAALIAFRLVWGFAGSKHARFIDFVPSPVGLFRYLLTMVKGNEPRTLGHNPAGGAMIIALLLTIFGISVTGYMIGMDQFFGVEWVEKTHKTLVNFCLLLIAFHLSGVIYASYQHSENLVKAMITGWKRRKE